MDWRKKKLHSLTTILTLISIISITFVMKYWSLPHTLRYQHIPFSYANFSNDSNTVPPLPYANLSDNFHTLPSPLTSNLSNNSKEIHTLPPFSYANLSDDSEVIHTLPPTEVKSDFGYMLALDYGDQGISSFVDFVSFLCFASQIGNVKVVEPFMIGSIIGQNASVNWSQAVKLSEVYDLETINKYAASKHIIKPTPYKTFLKESPRKLLVAQHKCVGLSWCIPCGHERARERGLTFSRMNGFEMVGHVCLKYAKDGSTTLGEIKRQLYENYKVNEIVVLFIRFGGVNTGAYNPQHIYRLHISLLSCCRSRHSSFTFVKSSKFVVDIAEQYIQEHLGGAKYMSVMIRLERTIGQQNIHSEKAPDMVSKCLSNLQKKITETKVKFKMQKIFMCLDVGKYGSRFLTVSNFTSYYDQFLSETLQPGMTLKKLDNTYSDVRLREHPGLVAALQRAIAARGDMLLLLSEHSTFQSSTEIEYKSLHSKQNVLHFSSKLCH